MKNEATQLAQHTHDLNQQRQDLVATITKEAEQILSQTEQPHLVNVIAGQNWHEGVLGIVASRITEETKRPTIVLTLTEDNLYKGSGRQLRDLIFLMHLIRTGNCLKVSGADMHKRVVFRSSRITLLVFK